MAAGISDSHGDLLALWGLGLRKNDISSECIGASERVGRWHGMCTLAGRGGRAIHIIDVHIWPRVR